MMGRSTIAILITIIVALSLAYVSTTEIKAVDINEYPYILYDDGTGTIIISDMQLQYAQIGESGWNPSTVKIGTWINTPLDDLSMGNNDNYDYYWGISRARANGYTLVPQMVDGVIVYDVNPNWYGIISSNGNVSKSIFIIEPQYTFPTGELYGNYTPSGWEQVLALPDNIAGKTVEEIIAEQTEITSIGQQAQAIQQESVSALDDYNNGVISRSQLDTILADNEDELYVLNSSTGASIGDLIVINNAITQNQTIQQISNKDEIIDSLTVSSNLSSNLYTIRDGVRNKQIQYQNGEVTQEEAVNYIKTRTNLLHSYLQNSNYSSIADQQAIQNTIEMIEMSLQSIVNYSDLDKSVSNEAQTSISEENEYFQELLSETTSSIADMSPSNDITSEEMNVAMEIVNGVWENPIIKKILPLTCCFLVICVALGIKYRL